MTRKYFGTDGIRGTVGTRTDHARLRAAPGPCGGSRVLKRTVETRPTVMIGKDTRISGYMLESALESGFNSAGVDVILLGPLPTPGVAYLTRALRAEPGCGHQRKPQRLSRQRNQVLQRPWHQTARRVGVGRGGCIGRWRRCGPSSAHLGKARRLDDAAGRYLEFLQR